MKKILTIVISAMFVMACNNQAKKQEVVANAKQVTIDSINAVNQHTADSIHAVVVRQHTIDSMQAVSRSSSTHTTVVTTGSQVDAPTTATKKKGWSNTAKGAAIGAGVGAVTGLIVDKKKGEGAIVGGLIGAGTGAGVGAIIDGKKKKKKN